MYQRLNGIRQFLDGRFYFPSWSMRWGMLEDTGRRKYINPFGRAYVYDVVLRSQAAKRRGHVILRNRGAVVTLREMKRGWEPMQDYSYFWKGVKVCAKPSDWLERLHVGAVRDDAAAGADDWGDEVSGGPSEAWGHVDWGAFADAK